MVAIVTVVTSADPLSMPLPVTLSAPAVARAVVVAVAAVAALVLRQPLRAGVRVRSTMFAVIPTAFAPGVMGGSLMMMPPTLGTHEGGRPVVVMMAAVFAPGTRMRVVGVPPAVMARLVRPRVRRRVVAVMTVALALSATGRGVVGVRLALRPPVVASSVAFVFALMP